VVHAGCLLTPRGQQLPLISQNSLFSASEPCAEILIFARDPSTAADGGTDRPDAMPGRRVGKRKSGDEISPFPPVRRESLRLIKAAAEVNVELSPWAFALSRKDLEMLGLATRLSRSDPTRSFRGSQGEGRIRPAVMVIGVVARTVVRLLMLDHDRLAPRL
jgi:hypothetical protein